MTEASAQAGRWLCEADLVINRMLSEEDLSTTIAGAFFVTAYHAGLVKKTDVPKRLRTKEILSRHDSCGCCVEKWTPDRQPLGVVTIRPMRGTILLGSPDMLMVSFICTKCVLTKGMEACQRHILEFFLERIGDPEAKILPLSEAGTA
jgi:hypothetical protein